MAPDDPDTLLDEIAEQLLEQVAKREAELVRLTQVRDAGTAAEADTSTTTGAGAEPAGEES